MACVPLDERDSRHTQAKQAFRDAAQLLNIDLDRHVARFQVNTTPTTEPFEHTAFDPAYRGPAWNPTTRRDDPASHEPTITIDNDFLGGSAAVKEYAALHELHHAKVWKDFVDSQPRLQDADNEMHRLSFNYDPRAYLMEELRIEQSVKAILVQKYGSEAAIPQDVQSLMFWKNQRESGFLQALQTP
jgi:hypothetical protein